MKLIPLAKLHALLLAQTQATIVSIVSCIEPKLKAKDVDKNRNPFMAGLTLKDGFTIGKVNKAQGRVDTNWQNEVKNELTANIEAERAASNLPPLSGDALEAEIANRYKFGTSWHRPIMAGERATALSVNKKDDDNGPAYLRIVVSAQGSSEYLRYSDGSTVEKNEVQPFEQDSYSSAPREIRTYALSSIVEIRINGESYRVIENFMDKPIQMRERVWEIAEAYCNGESKMSKV